MSSNDFTPDRLYVNVTELGALGHGIAFDDLYTGDGTTTNYALSSSVSNARDLLVSVQGYVQTPSVDYSLVGGTGISFNTGIGYGSHTGVPVPVYAYGPGSENFTGTMDNTDVYRAMVAALDLSDETGSCIGD